LTSWNADISRVIDAVGEVHWCCAVKTPEDEGRQLESHKPVTRISSWLLQWCTSRGEAAPGTPPQPHDWAGT